MRFSPFAKFHTAVLATLLAGIVLAPTALKAQDSSSMVGTVTDSTGAALGATTILLTNKSTGASYTQTTNKQGSYTFPNVAPHDGYTAEFSHEGFSSVRVDSLTLNVGQPRTLNEKLSAGAISTVEVSAANQQVTLNTVDASIGNNLDPAQLNELPVYDRTNGISTLFYLQPGVDSGSGAVAGARIDQTEVTIDGMDANDLAAGTTFYIVAKEPVDAVDQFTGTVAGLVSAIGTGSGAQFQLVTKQGTNKFHGNINEYHRDTTTVANSWFNNLVGLPRTPLIQNQFGGNLGGPIIKNKLFFFVNIADSRIVQSSSGEDTVPLSNLTSATPTLNYINNNEGCDDSSRLNTTPNCISSLSMAQVQQLDPAGMGFDAAELAFIAKRYPAANDLTQGDGVNTGGYRFTYPTPDNSINYVGRIDYNLSHAHKVFGRFTINRENSTQSLPVFPKDPATHPFIDRSYSYVVSDIWTIGNNKVNQFYYGDTISKFDFPNAYNPTGANAFGFSGLTSPYSGTDGQKRRVPVPEVRDDFNWQLGNHSLVAGGVFKFIKTNSNLINNFNFVTVGLGAGIAGGLNSSLRPANIYADTGANDSGVAVNDFDSLFATSLGAISEVSTNYDYNTAGAPLPAAGGSPRAYRYFETELYVGDTWKLTPKLTLSYGLRYQLYSVPYEAHGEESVETLGNLSQSQSTIQAYVKDRVAQSAAGDTSFTGLPNYSVILGGKKNHGPNLYAPSYKDFAPRVAFSYAATPTTVINASAGIVYDRTVINAINFLQDQISYLFSNTQNNLIAEGSTPNAALAATPRIGTDTSGALVLPSNLIPAPSPIGIPLTPYVYEGIPYGLAYGETNFVISPNLKDPYSISLNAGIQQDLPWHMVMKLNYVGRLARRLLADADAGQVLDFPDKISGQTLSQAFAGLTTQLRNGATTNTLTPEPFFENVFVPGTGVAYGFANNTQLVNAVAGQYPVRGDISDSLYELAGFSNPLLGGNGFAPNNVGIPGQFGANAYLTNQGNSNYHALLLTIDKNMSNGLSFDVNYTWAHSIDNTSESANANALFSNSGFICDITKPRACRGSSDFDVRQEITSDFIYDFPFGRGKEFGGNMSRLADEAVGGWAISGTPIYRTGQAYSAYASAYLASFDNLDPAIFIGNKGDLKSKVNVSNGVVYNFAGGQAGANKVLSEFRGPIGLEYGNRNILEGPGAFFMNAGLSKKFPIIRGVDLKFRADFYNILNHPSFGLPGVGIVGNASQFGQISSTVTDPGGVGARVGQFSLRLEF
jgi:hypothetical protein